MLKTFAASLFVLATLSCSYSIAQQDDDSAEKFAQADADGDGELSRAELSAYLKEKLPGFKQVTEFIAMLDVDEDRVITLEEFRTRREIMKILRSSAPQPVEFADQYNANYLKRGPFIGDSLDGLSAFDENGDEFELDKTRGKYTVVVFGCLT